MGDTSSEGKVASANERSRDGSQSGPGEPRWPSIGHFNSGWSREPSSKIHIDHFGSLLLCMDSMFAFTLSEHQSSLASKQTHRFTDSQLFCLVQMNLNEADYPRKCTQVRLRQPEHLLRERALSLIWGEKPIQMESRIKDNLIPHLIITIKREEQHLSLTVL